VLAVLAVMSVFFYWICFAFTRERVTGEPEAAPALGQELAAVARTRAWWMLLGMGCMMFALAIFPFYAGLYFLKYVFLDEAFASKYFTILTLGMLFGALVNLILVRRFDRRMLAIFAGLWGAVFSLCSYLVEPGDYALLAGFGFLAFMGTGIGAPNLWAMVADTADHIERRTGRRIAGLTAAGVSFSMKLGLGIGGSAVGYILAYNEFTANVDAGPEVQDSIRMMIGLFPALGYTLFALAASDVRVDRGERDELISEQTEKATV